jgi:hypothetical protein
MFEEDTAGGTIYRPDAGHVPLSRRPREVLTLHDDGTATFETGGPADRPVPQQAHWTVDRKGDGLRVTIDPSPGVPSLVLHIRPVAPDALVVTAAPS